MAGWQVFGTLGAGAQPLSLFDTLTGQIGQTIVAPTTATGTNAIALALNANAPIISSYVNYQQFSFVAANSSTGSVTVNVNSIGALNLYKPGNLAAGSGDITAGVFYVIAFNQALNSGAGGFQIVSATPATLSLPVTVANGGTGVTSFGTPFGVLCAGTTSAGNLQVVAALGAAGQVLTSNGAGALPTFQGTGAAGTLVSIQTFTTSQTVTIPASATKLWVRLQGAGGGAVSGGGGAAAGGYLEKYFTGFTPGNTLALTIGAGGVNTGGTGGASSLASGTQTISTLTCNGGAGQNTTTSGTVVSGGSASGGDININGGDGANAFSVTIACAPNQTSAPVGGMSVLSTARMATGAGYGFGGGAVGLGVGAAGVAVMLWFT